MQKESKTILDLVPVLRQLADTLESLSETLTEQEVQTFEPRAGLSAGRTNTRTACKRTACRVDGCGAGSVGGEVPLGLYGCGTGVVTAARSSKTLRHRSQRVPCPVGGSKQNWLITQTARMRSCRLPPVPAGWRVRPLHSSVLPCRIP